MNYFKKIILTLLFIPFFIDFTYSQWAIVNTPTRNNLNSISFSEGAGWIVGDKGTMLYKNNDVWVNYEKITDQNLYSLCLTNPNTGWAVGSNGTILYYNGQIWINYKSPTRLTLYSVAFRSPETGIAVGEQGTVILFRNGSWELSDQITVGDLYAVTPLEHLAIIAGGRENVSIPIMMMPIDNPKTSSAKTFDPEFVNIRSFAMIDAENVWAVGRPGAIFYFNGKDWEKISTDQSLPSLNSITFCNKTNGFAVGYNGTIMTHSKNGWTKEYSPTNVKLNGTAISNNTLYAVGNNGTLVSCRQLYENRSEFKNTIASKISLETYPNPASGLLRAIIPEEFETETGTIIVSNSYGEIVLIDKYENLKSGQEFQINTTSFKNGLYLINITSSKIKASGKFVILN